jgi:hypothetical protein
MKPAYIITLVLVGIVAVLAFVWMQRSRATRPQFKNLDEQMRWLAAQAVDMTDKNNGIKLDYTPESIQRVDQVLGKIHEEYERTKSPQGINGLAMAYGAYIGEVIRRSEPDAKWEQSDSIGGENSYPIQWRGGSSYVCAWCYRRITNGQEDNVWHKYIAIRDRSRKKPSAGETNDLVGR